MSYPGFPDSCPPVGGGKVIRVFPRKTNATPVDADVRIAQPPGLFDEADEIHISVAFTWDLPTAERLAHEWEVVAPVRIGGPATGQVSGAFVAGQYLRDGYVITSRGCPNRCWFCTVWRREGTVRELPIVDGWNVLDDNLLACSDAHIRSVFRMLARQDHAPRFTGGLEAARLQAWHAEALKALRPDGIFFAYDTPDDLEPLCTARTLLRDVGFADNTHALRCYVLCGYPGDSLDAAEERMRQTLDIGYMPMAMAWRDEQGDLSLQWRQFQRRWVRPEIIYSRPRLARSPNTLYIFSAG